MTDLKKNYNNNSTESVTVAKTNNILLCMLPYTQLFSSVSKHAHSVVVIYTERQIFCVFIQIGSHIRTHTHTQTHRHPRMHAHTHTHTHVRTHARTHAHTHTHTHTCTQGS